MKFLRAWLGSGWFGSAPAAGDVAEVNRQRAELAKLDDETLRSKFRKSQDLLEVVAIVAVVAWRVLGMDLFDVQVQGALALARGRIAEMQTGEGKTLGWRARVRAST
jgi:preprotein translocase subunit SecA